MKLKKGLLGGAAATVLAVSAGAATSGVEVAISRCSDAKVDMLMVAPQKDGTWAGRVNGSVVNSKGGVAKEGGASCSAKTLAELQATCLEAWKKVYCP